MVTAEIDEKPRAIPNTSMQTLEMWAALPTRTAFIISKWSAGVISYWNCTRRS
jgi:hypothetical protein